MSHDLNCLPTERFPCGPEGDVAEELRKIAAQLNSDVNEIISEIEAIELPDVESSLGSLQTILSDHASDAVRTLGELSSLMGLPYKNDKERLAALGIGIISQVAWSLSGTNMKNLRKLYRAFGRDYLKTKNACSGAYGRYFIVNSVPRLVQFVSSTPVYHTTEELSSELGFQVFSDDILQFENSGEKVTLVFIEEFISVNQGISVAAQSRGVAENQINVKLFGNGDPLSTYDLKRLRDFGLTNEQISTSQNVSLSTDRLQTLLQQASNFMVNGVTQVGINLSNSAIAEAVALMNFEFIELDSDLLSKLLSKNSDFEIEAEALNEPWIDGIDHAMSDSDLRKLLDSVSRVEAGTHYISNKMLSRAIDARQSNFLKLLRILGRISVLVPGDDARPIAQSIAELQVILLTPEEPAPPNITFKSYDSGASLLQRNFSIDRTFGVVDKSSPLSYAFDFTATATSGVEPLTISVPKTFFRDAYSSAFKATDALGAKLNQTLLKLEALTSLGLSITGAGSFNTSFLKCAGGLSFDFDYNPLRELLNKGIDAFNALLDKMTAIMNKILKTIVCSITCMSDALGLGGLKLELKFCSVSIPPLLDTSALQDLAKFGDLLNNLYLNNLKGVNALRFGLLDLHDSFSDVSTNDCNCSPLGGLFGAMRVAVPVAQVGLGAIV